MEDHINTLYSLSEGSYGRVSSLRNEGAMRRRLQDIGLIEVLCIRKSPSGDPVAYLIRGAVIALRKEDAVKVDIVQKKMI